MADEEPTTKTLNRYLTVNWKSEAVGARKTEPDPSRQSPHEFAIPVSIEIVVPKVEIPELTARVEVPQANVESSLLAEEARQGDPEAWKEIADEHIEGLDETDDSPSWELVYELVGRVMTKSDVLADPEDVRRYVNRRLRETNEEEA